MATAVRRVAFKDVRQLVQGNRERTKHRGRPGTQNPGKSFGQPLVPGPATLSQRRLALPGWPGHFGYAPSDSVSQGIAHQLENAVNAPLAEFLEECSFIAPEDRTAQRVQGTVIPVAHGAKIANGSYPQLSVSPQIDQSPPNFDGATRYDSNMLSITDADVGARLDALDAAVAELRDLSYSAVSPVVRLRTLDRLETARRLQTVVSHDIIHSLTAEEFADIGGPPYKVVADWCRISYAEARRRVRDAAQLAPRLTLTGQQLPPELPATAEQWRAGMLDLEHLRVIKTFVRDLPADIPAPIVEDAEAFLAQQATELRPDQLETAAQRIAVDLNPDGKFTDADRARKRSFTWGRQGPDGMSEGKLIADPEQRALIDAWLAKFAAPGMANPADPTPCMDAEPSADAAATDNRTPSQRRHDAITALVRGRLGDPQLGHHNGLPVTVVVSTTLEQLSTAAGRAVTASGTQIPMRDLIAMASQAYHYLAVYDGHSNRPLYLARSKRIATADQRLILYSSERGCTHPGCDVSADKCEVHHIVPWATGGHTNIDTLTLSCTPHHKLVGNGWTTTKLPDGRTAWHPPPHLRRGPRTNNYHHPERLLGDNDGERAGP